MELHMNESDIRKYAGLMQELGLTGLEITEENHVVRLERTAPAAIPSVLAASPVLTASPAPVEEPTQAPTDDIRMTSPIVGVFYAAPAEDVPPYVSIGDHVTKGTVLCIIEAMKLMNEITAEEDGIIAEICAKNGQIVEFGTELFRIRRCHE